MIPVFAATLLAATAWAMPVVPLEGPVDVGMLLLVARQRQAANTQHWYEYSFRQTMVEEVIDGDGQVKRTQTSVYDVLPTPKGTEKHLVSRDGDEPTESEIRKVEKRNQALQKRFDRMQEKRQREAEKRAKEAGLPPPPKPGAAPSRVIVAAPAPPVFAAPPPVVEETPGAPPAAPIPPCDPEDPSRAVRAPLPGTPTQSVSRPKPPPDDVRRGRQDTSDYSIFELLSLADYDYAGTCTWGDRPVHVINFRPPATFDPANPVEKVATAMKGTILIDGADACVVRAEGRTVAPIKWGAGLVALKAAHVIYEYRKVNDEVWLPASSFVDFDSRVVFNSDHERFTHRYDDYRKASVGMETEFGGMVNPPKQP